MSGYTPGPWRTQRDRVPVHEYAVYAEPEGRNGPFEVAEIVRTVNIPREEEIANARLMAAAPDLYEACRLRVDAVAAMKRAVSAKDDAARVEAQGRLTLATDLEHLAVHKAESGRENPTLSHHWRLAALAADLIRACEAALAATVKRTTDRDGEWTAIRDEPLRRVREIVARAKEPLAGRRTE